MKIRNKKKKRPRSNYMEDEIISLPTKRKAGEEMTNVTLKKGKLITFMITNIPKEQSQYTLDVFLKSKGIVCWGCRANFISQVAFIDVEVKDCEKVLSLNDQEWNECELVVKVDETTNVRKKKSKVKSFETIERNQRTLCCKNVPYDVFAQRFESVFQGIKEVNIMRDRRTGRPTGIAFVEFFTDEELETALANEEAVRINGRKLELHRCGKDPDKEKASKMLQKYFKIKSNEDESSEELQRSSEELPDKNTSFFSRNKQVKGLKTVVISNLPLHQNLSSLTKYCWRNGITVTECRANYDAQIAFLDVEEKDFEKALRLHSKKWNGSKLVVEEDTSRKAEWLRTKKPLSNQELKIQSKCEQAERTLCCKNLPFGIFAQKLEILFQDVKEVRGLFDAFDQPTGMAYVEFETQEALDAAYAKKESIEIDGRKLQLSLLGAILTPPKTDDASPSKKVADDPEPIPSIKNKSKSFGKKKQQKVSKKPKKEFKKSKKFSRQL